MDKTSKQKFIAEYMSRIENSIMDKVEKMPEDWNGFELRQYIADRFTSEIIGMEKSRKHAYLNAVIVENL
jgi:hypothetical protein